MKKKKFLLPFLGLSVLLILINLKWNILNIPDHFKEKTVQSSSNTAYVGGIANAIMSTKTPASGTVSIPFFVVDFPDVTFDKTTMSKEDINSLLFNSDNNNSFSSYEANASYGKLQITGNTFFYTAQDNMSSYKNSDNSFENLAKEVLSAYDNEIDYSLYDQNNDNVIDCFVLNIAGSDSYWYGCQTSWYDNTDYTLDGMHLGNYIIDDAQPIDTDADKLYYVEEMAHEFGHCMGLPDLYKPNESVDYESMKGSAGTEIMDEMTGDYSDVSKLLLGWIKSGEINIYTGGTKTYSLSPSSISSNCILIPKNLSQTLSFVESDNSLQKEDLMNAVKNDITSGEYFLLEYDTATGNYSNVLTDETQGIRILHANTSIYYDSTYDDIAFKYNQFSPYYSESGPWIMRLVNDNNGYFNTGDICNSNVIQDFKWYDDDGKLTQKVPYTITIESIENDVATIQISENN